MKKITSKQILEIVKILCTAVVSVVATLTVQSCTTSLSLQKNNSNTSNYTKQSTDVKNDSVTFKYN